MPTANKQKVKAQATQDFVPIKEVRDGVVILKDGSLRVLLMASSINLALKSQDEQQAVIAQFQNFLNSLEFTVEFFIQSRSLDIRPYIALLQDRYQKEPQEATVAKPANLPVPKLSESKLKDLSWSLNIKDPYHQTTSTINDKGPDSYLLS